MIYHQQLKVSRDATICITFMLTGYHRDFSN